MRRPSPLPLRTCCVVLVAVVVASACQRNSIPSAEVVSTTAATPPGAGTTGPTSSVVPPPSSPADPTTTTTSTVSSTSTSTTSTSTTTTSTTPPPPPDTGSIYDVRPPSDLPAPPIPPGWTSAVIGTSVLGRDIVALHRPAVPTFRTMMVVGGIHGNEPVSPPAVRALVEASYADDIEVWLVPELNPDGVAAGTRWNANGVDLNRNFTWDWRPDDGGPGPLSEPESTAITELVATVQPDLVIWVHQPYGYVSSVGDTDRALESAWSDGSGLVTRSGVTQHGGGESWTAFEARLPAMLIEIDSWAATEAMVQAQLDGYQTLLDSLGWED